MTRNLIPTAGSPACTTLKEIRSNCGNLHNLTPHSALSNAGLLAIAGSPEVILNPGKRGDLNGSMQHQARTPLALKIKAKIARQG